VLISIEKYEEKVICDVPMEAGHILLGRPWEFNKHTLHDDLTNKISFLHKGKKIILCPLTPQQVRENQVVLKKKKLEYGKRKEKKIKSKTLIQIK